MRTDKLLILLLSIAGFFALIFIITTDDFFDGLTLHQNPLFLAGIILPILISILITIDLFIAYVREKIGRPEEETKSFSEYRRLLRAFTWGIIFCACLIFGIILTAGVLAGIYYGAMIVTFCITPMIGIMVLASVYRCLEVAIEKAREHQWKGPMLGS